MQNQGDLELMSPYRRLDTEARSQRSTLLDEYVQTRHAAFSEPSPLLRILRTCHNTYSSMTTGWQNLFLACLMSINYALWDCQYDLAAGAHFLRTLNQKLQCSSVCDGFHSIAAIETLSWVLVAGGSKLNRQEEGGGWERRGFLRGWAVLDATTAVVRLSEATRRKVRQALYFSLVDDVDEWLNCGLAVVDLEAVRREALGGVSGTC